MRHIPNTITILRITLTPLLVALLVSKNFSAALYLVIFMGISDALDGFLAKHHGWQSRVGEFLDPLADKLMLISVYAVLALQEALPVWLVAVVIGRDVLIATGYFYCRLFSNIKLDFLPSKSSKVNTCMQVFLVLAVLMNKVDIGSEAVVGALIVVVAVTTLVSGLVYALSARQSLLRRGFYRTV